MKAPTPSQTMFDPPEPCWIATLCSLNFKAGAADGVVVITGAGVVVAPAAAAFAADVMFVQLATGVQHSLVAVVFEVFLRFQASFAA